MPDKLTDKEVVKAFTEKTELIGSMSSVYLDEDKGLELYMAMRNILDLINHLQAEKEALINGQETLQKYIAEQKAENERLKEKAEKCFYCTEQANKKIGEIKAEAYKEFAEKVCYEITDAIINNGKVIKERIEKHNVNRLEDSFCCMCDGKIRALGGIEYFIKNLLKELVGEDK